MAHPLELKIGRVRRQTRWLLVLYALGWTVASIGAAVLVLGLADYWIRFHDPGIRLMASLAIVAVAAWSLYRFWYAIATYRLGDVQIARRIERYYPELTDRLASTIEFLKQSDVDVQAGSAALRRAVIHETARDAQPLDFSRVFQPAPARRALGAAALVVLVGGAIALASPAKARIGLARLARPFGDDAWPRVYNLAFRDPPTRLAAGQTFEAELLRDAEHRVPDEARIHYRYETGGEVTEEVESMQLLGGAMVARKENVHRPFAYRAEGGDDQSMDWIPLEVVEPPRIEALKLTLHPPAYSGLPVEPSDKNIHALRGTRVELTGAATKRLRAASVQQEGGPQLQAQITADGYGFSLASDAAEPFVIDKTGTYTITLVDREGLEGGADERFDIRSVADLAPSLTIEQPSANIFVTANGTVPLKIVAKDDLAIREIGLHFSRSDNADVEDFAVPLYRGPQTAAPVEAGGLLVGGRLGESRALEHRWSLSELNLKQGAQITVWATAGDYLPQSGKSTVRRLTIISPGELEERLAQRQMLIFGELERVLKLQNDARGQTKSLAIQLDQVGHLQKQDVDHAQAAELNQRQISRTLTSAAEGIPAQIADFLADLENNRVDSPDMQRRMTSIAAELDRLGKEHLGTIERELTAMIKAAQAELPRDPAGAAPAGPTDPQVGQSLKTAGEHQDQVVASLEGMIDELRQWDNYRRFAREVAQLQSAQQEIARAVKEIAPQTLGREMKDLDAQQQADLRKLAHDQAELSRRLEKTQQQMAQMAAALEASDPLAAAAIADGLHHAQQRGISGKMRQSSDRIGQNQLAQAASDQAQVARDLDEMAGILSNRREQELARLVEQLREAEAQMAQARARQAGLRKQMQEAAAQPESPQRKEQLQRLSRQQRELEQEAARLARRLERLQAEQAGRSTADAVGKMGQAGSAGESGNASDAEQQAAAAEKDLEEAQQQLAERRRQAEEDLAREQLARLEDALKSLHERQKKLTAETERLEKLRVSAGKLTRAQTSTVHDLASQQKALQIETSLLAEKLSLAEVIHLALDGASRQMARAGELLQRQRTGSQTQTAQEAARLRFAQLLEALSNKGRSTGGQQEGGAAGGASSGGRPDGNQVLAQLKLLKILQEDLNSRYRGLSGEENEPAAAQQLAEIAAEQGKLAELTLKLAEPPADNPEDHPESLPDVRNSEPESELAPALDDLLREDAAEPKP
jgi:hypothetical protein